jgi:ubiquinone/menaquinone biosynthesis C-methylase UbiE
MAPAMPRAATSSPSAKAQVQALFDSLALEYVRTREQQFSFVAQKRLVVDMLDGVHGRLLEVGCGPAVMAPELLAMGFELHGLDVSPEMVRRARQRMSGHPLGKRCRFELGDVERLPYPDAFFDAVLAMGVLEYLPNREHALRGTARVLKPGGTAVFTLPNRASTYHVARSAYDALRGGLRRLRRRQRTLPRLARPCLPWAFDGELRRAGLEPIENAACNFIFFPLKEWHPGSSDALNRMLHPLARRGVARLLGAQYVVKTRRRAVLTTP